MLKTDERMPFLHRLWSAAGMRQFVDKHITSEVGGRIESVAIEQITYHPGRACTLLCSLEMEGEKHTRCVASFAKDDRLEEAYAATYAAQVGADRRPAALPVPSHRGLVEFFPHDYHLPGLEVAMGEGTAALPVEMSAVEVVQYLPHRRCVLRYASRDGACDVIGKVYQVPTEAMAAYNLLRALHAAGCRLALAVPDPLAVDSAAGTLLMRRAAGTAMDRLLADASRDGSRALVVLAAVVLAALHTLAIERSDVRSLAGEIAHLRKRTVRLPFVAPMLAHAVEEVLARVDVPDVDSRPLFSHGDFKLSHVIVDGARTTIIDFDRACAAPPALDVGNFMADIRHQALVLERDAGPVLARIFLEAYVDSAAARIEKEALCYEAVALARMAVRAFRQGPQAYAAAPASSMPVRLLEEARSCLAML